jgi:hypothetical protein
LGRWRSGHVDELRRADRVGEKDGWSYAVNAGNGTVGVPGGGSSRRPDLEQMRSSKPYTAMTPGAAWNNVLTTTTGGEANTDDTPCRCKDPHKEPPCELQACRGYGKLRALNACATTEQTRVRWMTNDQDLPNNGADIRSARAGGIVFIGTDQGHLVVLGDPSVVPGIGYQCSNIDYTTSLFCILAGYVPIPKMLADVPMPDGGDIAGLRNEPALAKGRVFVGTGYGHVYMLDTIGVHFGPSAQYDDGVTPSVALAPDGVVVEVHKSSAHDTLWDHVGRVSGDTIGWGPSHQYDDGVTPSVAIIPNRVVVEVHKSSAHDTLWDHVGRVRR